GDIDGIGSKSVLTEVEVLASVCEVLTRLGFADFVVRLNHRRALTALLACAGVPDGLHGEALIALDKLDKIGVDGVQEELHRRGVEVTATKACLDFFSGVAAHEDLRPGASLERLRDFVKSHPTGQNAITELEEIVHLA